MAISVCEVLITDSPLDLPARENDSASGAVVDFSGVVRPSEDGRDITGLEYEAHSIMAEHQMRRIAEVAVARFGLAKVVIRHRIGFVLAGQTSVVVRVESAHRLAAFKANQWIMDELKQIVPIWKRPVFHDGNASGERSARDLSGSLSSTSARL